MKYLIFILALISLIGGCATTAGITYRTDPPGAVISQQGEGNRVGVTPVRLLYQWSPEFIEDGCLKVQGVTARWVDGTAVSSPDVLRVCGSPGEYEYKLSKPADKRSSSRGSGQKTIVVGEQLTAYPQGCLLYLDSVGVSHGQLTANFYAYNAYTFSLGKFSVEAAYADNSSEVNISGINRSETYLVSRKLNFSVATGFDVSALTLKTTCDGSASTVEIPLYTPDIQEAVLSFGGSSGRGSGRNEIRLIKSGGVYEIPVVLNGVLTMRFIVDTGASDVFISPDVALTLYRTGTIRESDYMPGAVYRLADGTRVKSKRFRLKSIQIGNNLIRGVTCAISESLEASMLLGQSALERLGEYTIDYKRGVLILE